jgi:hypothetical protein
VVGSSPIYLIIFIFLILLYLLFLLLLMLAGLVVCWLGWSSSEFSTAWSAVKEESGEVLRRGYMRSARQGDG